MWCKSIALTEMSGVPQVELTRCFCLEVRLRYCRAVGSYFPAAQARWPAGLTLHLCKSSADGRPVHVYGCILPHWFQVDRFNNRREVMVKHPLAEIHGGKLGQLRLELYNQ